MSASGAGIPGDRGSSASSYGEPPQSTWWTDLAIIGIASLLVVGAAREFEAFERIVEWVEEHETWQADEFLTLALVLSVAFGIFAYRRWRELRRESVWRRQAEAVQRMAEARAMHEATARNMVDGLAIIDHGQRVQFWNPSMELLLGVPSEEALGRPLLEILTAVFARTADPEATARNEEAGIHAALDGTVSRTQVHLLGTGTRDLEVLYFPVPLPGVSAQQGFGTLVRDVTQERQLTRMKDEMVSVVSHELRTPLAALVGFAELLVTREWPEEQKRGFLETMLKEGRRLSTLLDDFLDVRRLQSAAATIAPRQTELVPLVTRATELLRDDAAHPVTVVAPGNLPAVRADPARIEQVLANLLSNAVKYSPQGGEITVSASQNGDLVEVAVCDRGLGVPASDLPHLFEDFYRVETADRRQIGGTGLGLAICKRIVEAHGGRIWAQSPGAGQGSTFRFTLPAAEMVIPPAEHTARSEPGR